MVDTTIPLRVYRVEVVPATVQAPRWRRDVVPKGLPRLAFGVDGSTESIV
jgi:hypothetical protein